MATTTYEPIATVTASNSTTPTLTFTSISSAYTDLVVVGQFGWQTSDDYLRITFNGDTTQTNYSMTNVRGDGSAAASGRYSGSLGRYDVTAHPGTNGSLNTIVQINVMNYANNNTFKSWLVRHNAASIGTLAAVGLWRDTNTITSITLSEADGGNFLSGSTFTLYGIANAALGAPKATGGTITYDSTYFYHTFGASGTFTPQQNLTDVDYLVIAGGGGGGDGNANTGGGGAGGLRSTVDVTGGGGTLESKISLASGTGYTVTVGAGGVGNSNGVDSSISGSGLTTITSVGGGKTATLGGSGGGARYDGGSTGYGAGTANQGYRGGGASATTSPYGSGGGGGAGGVGGDRNTTTGGAGNGGTGVAIPSIANITGTGVATFYAGGGSGSAEAGVAGTTNGGGGVGSVTVNVRAGDGVTNTGGGGGASSGGSALPGNGGSGIVVIRYAK